MGEYSGISVAMALGMVSLVVIATLYVLLRIVRERLVTYIRKTKLVDEHRELLLVPGEDEHDISLLDCRVCHKFALIRSKLVENKILQAYRDPDRENQVVSDDPTDVKLQNNSKENASSICKQSSRLDQIPPQYQLYQSSTLNPALTQLPQSTDDDNPIKKVDLTEEVYRHFSAHDSISKYMSMKKNGRNQTESSKTSNDMSVLSLMDDISSKDCYWCTVEEKLLDEYVEAPNEQRNNVKINELVVQYWIDTVNLISSRNCSQERLSEQDCLLHNDMSRQASYEILHSVDVAKAAKQQEMAKLDTLCENHDHYELKPSKENVEEELFHTNLCTGPYCNVQHVGLPHDKESWSNEYAENISDEIFNIESLFELWELQEHEDTNETTSTSELDTYDLLPAHHLSESDKISNQVIDEQVNIKQECKDSEVVMIDEKNYRLQREELHINVICDINQENVSLPLTIEENELVECKTECEGSMPHEVDIEVDNDSIDHVSQLQEEEVTEEQVSDGHINNISGIGHILFDESKNKEDSHVLVGDYNLSKVIEESSGNIEIEL